MRKELYICDICKNPIKNGYDVHGVIQDIKESVLSGGYLDLRKGSHFCVECFNEKGIHLMKPFIKNA